MFFFKDAVMDIDKISKELAEKAIREAVHTVLTDESHGEFSSLRIIELKCIEMSKTPKAQSTLESIQLSKDDDDNLESGSCENSLIVEPHAYQADAIKASLNTEIHSVVTEATVVYANQPDALSSEVLLGTEGNGDDADHAVVGSLTSDCDYDLALVEWLDPGWHTALVLTETLVSPGNDPDLNVSESREVSLITDDLPVVDSAVDSRGQQRAEDDLQGTDQLLTRSCADCVTTEKHYAVPSEDSLNSDKEISLNIKDHDDRPAVDFIRDSVSTSDQSLSSVASAIGSIVTVDSFNKALLISNKLDQGKDNPIDQSVVSQNTENLINPMSVSESIQPLINETLEDNIISAPEDRPLFTTDCIGSCEIEMRLSRMHLGSVITCHDDQSLESDSEDDMVDPLAHTSHSHHLCESVVRPKVQLSGHTWSPSYETDDCLRYNQDRNMMEYKYKYSQHRTSAWVSVPHYIWTRGESANKRMQGEKQYEEKEWERCSSQCDRHSLIEHSGQWRIARAVEADTEEIVPMLYMRDLVMDDGFNQLDEERVGNQLVLYSLSRALNELKKDRTFWRSLREGDDTFMRENQRLNGEMKKKDMMNFNSAKEWRAERKRERRRDQERNCDVTKWMSSRLGMESSVIGLHQRPPSRPLLRELVLTRTSFSRTDARTIEAREMILQRSRIAYKIKCLQRQKAAAEGLTLTEGGGGPEDRGDREIVMDITGQSKKASKGKGSKGKESGGGECNERDKLGLGEIAVTDDRNKEEKTKVRTGQRSKDKRREERERQRCSKETDLISDQLARMDIEKIDGEKEDETVSKISEGKMSNNCCVETNETEKDNRKQIKDNTNRTIVLTDEEVMSKASGEREEEAREENAKTFQVSLNVQEIRDGEEGPTGRNIEHQKDSEETRNSDGDVKLREIAKRQEVEVEVTNISTSCDETSIIVLESQALARPMTDSQTPLTGKGKQQRNLPYKRTEGLQEEINSKGEVLQGGRQVNFPECQAQEHRSPGELGEVAGFWRKEKRVHKDKDEKDGEGQTWRDQGGNGREGETGGVGRSRRARQRGNQLQLFSKKQRQKHSNMNDPHTSESSCDWRSREKEGPEKHVESRMGRQKGERPQKGEKSHYSAKGKKYIDGC